MSGFNTKEVNNNGDYEITFYTENREDFKKVQSLCRELIGNGKPISTEGDLISRSELKKAIKDSGYSHYFEIFDIIDNAPTIDLKDIYQEGYYDGHLEGYTKAINEERPQGELKEYKPLEVDYNVKAAVENLKTAYWSNDSEKYAKAFTEADQMIVSAICHYGYIVVKGGAE